MAATRASLRRAAGFSLSMWVAVAAASFGQSATYTYDSLNRLTSATISGSRIEYTYDSAGNMTRVLTPYSIAVSKTGTGAGVVSDDLGKINCGTDCGGVYDLNTLATLTATAADGSVFAGWTGACGGAGLCSVVVDGIKSVGASFVIQNSDLTISATDGVTSAAPGESVTYTLLGANAGPSAAPGSTLSASFSAALSCTWTCAGTGGGSCVASGSGNINETVSLPAGGSVTYTAICAIAPGATGSITASASISAPGGLADPNATNNTASDSDTLTPRANLGITKTDGTSTAVPGQSTAYTIVASNPGPSHAPGSTVQTSFPPSLACSWTCAGSGGGGCAAAGSGSFTDTVNLPAGGSVTYSAACAIDPGVTGTLAASAVVMTAGGIIDPTPDDNSATDTDTLTPQANLGISKTDGAASAVPGQSTTYTIVASNAGPSHAPASTVADAFPASVSCNWTCAGAGGGVCAPAGSGALAATVNLPAGGSVAYSAVCSIQPGATGSLSNTASVATSATVTDLVPANNSATDIDSLTPQANLGIGITDGSATAVPGRPTSYTIVAANSGPSRAPGSTITVDFPAGLTCEWTCAGSGGATCPASGSGNISALLDLPASGSVTYTAACPVTAGATGTLVSTAAIAVGAGVTDLVPANNSSTDTDTLTPEADLGITVTNGSASTVPGQSTTYTVVASNAGPSHAPGGTVTDTFPAGLTCNWTCAGAGGGVCTASGSGNIATSVSLPSGGSATFTAICAVAPGATGTLASTATVAAAVGITDLVLANNLATDTDTLTPQANLGITKTDGTAGAVPGQSTTYSIVASNGGPSHAPGSTVADTFPAALTCNWTCIGAGGGVCPASGAGSISASVDLPTGGSVTFTANCLVQVSATGTLTNTATVAPAAGVTDLVPANNSATDTDTLSPLANLGITKTDGVTSAVPGESTTYSIVASNAGPSHVETATVTDTFPAALTCNWTCAGAGGGACSAGGTGGLSDAVVLPAGGSVTYTAVCAIAAGATGTLSNTATVATAVPDPSPGNESSTDTTTLSSAADLWIVKSTPAPGVGVGSSVVYTLQVGNRGPSAATALEVQDALPAGTVFQSAVGAGWSCAESSAIVTCTRSNLGAGQQSNIALTLQMPESAGQVVNEATVTSATPEAAAGDETDSASVQVFAPPTMVEVGSVAATETGAVTEGMVTSASITQLYLEASHELYDPAGDTDPTDATNPACYRLFRALPNGTFPNSTCVDPTGVPVDSASYGVAGLNTVALLVNGGLPLQKGNYRLRVCAAGSTHLEDAYGNALDGDQDGTEGDDFVRDFEVRVTNLLLNPNFDSDLNGWSVSSQMAGEIVHDSATDSSHATTSGSVWFENLTGVGSLLRLSQCLALAPGDSYFIGARIKNDAAGTAHPVVDGRLETFSTFDCSGGALSSQSATLAIGDTGGSWLEDLQPVGTPPSSAVSGRVAFQVTGEAIGDWTWIDDVRINANRIFVDGFESGDASSWNGEVGLP